MEISISLIASALLITIASLVFVWLKTHYLVHVFSAVILICSLVLFYLIHVFAGLLGYSDRCGIVDILIPEGIGCAGAIVITTYAIIISGLIHGIIFWARKKYFSHSGKKDASSEKVN